MYRSSATSADRQLELLRDSLPGHDKIFLRGDIPPHKLETVVDTYGLPDPASVLLIYDDTVFGSAEDGFVFTTECFGFKELGEGPVLLDLRSLSRRDVELDEDGLFVKRGRVTICAGGDQTAILEGLHRALSSMIDFVSASPRTQEPAAGQPRDEMDLVRLLERDLPACGDLYWRGRIPRRKLGTVCKLYGIADPQRVLVIYDDTLFGSAAEGFLFTATHFGFKGIAEDPVWIPLAQMPLIKVVRRKGGLWVKDVKVEITGVRSAAAVADGLERVLQWLARR
ncbi:MAG: hypothetical protein JRI23_18070 [Deltaproteobacteria bacterium]|jgi:hypothetical protein|nr:hypothetical protein [Deltaproteobacteria bacterium]MBW2533753.1 hypothetical protein [Deltaproteobacteria bacterium]